MTNPPENTPDVGFDALLVDDADRVIAAGSRAAMAAACRLVHGRVRGDRILTSRRWLDALPGVVRLPETTWEAT